MFIGYTDASVNVIGSIHGYILYNNENKKLIDIGLENWNVGYNIIIAESYSLILIGRAIRNLNIQDGVIYTDSRALESIIKTEIFHKRKQDPNYMFEEINRTIGILKLHNFKVKYISRSLNLIADKLCGIVKPYRLKRTRELNRLKWIGQSINEPKYKFSIILQDLEIKWYLSIRKYGNGIELKEKQIFFEKNWKNECKDILEGENCSIKIPFNDLIIKIDKLINIIEKIFILKSKAEIQKKS